MVELLHHERNPGQAALDPDDREVRKAFRQAVNHLRKTFLETALNAELDEHLGYVKGDPAGRGRGNQRNGRPHWMPV